MSIIGRNTVTQNRFLGSLNVIPLDISSKKAFVFFSLLFKNCLGKPHVEAIVEASFSTASKTPSELNNVFSSSLQKFMGRN